MSAAASDTIINAVQACNRYSSTWNGVTYADWYIPSIYELQLLYGQRAIVGGFASSGYWTSNYKYGSAGAWVTNFATGNLYVNYTAGTENVRVIRSF